MVTVKESLFPTNHLFVMFRLHVNSESASRCNTNVILSKPNADFIVKVMHLATKVLYYQMRERQSESGNVEITHPQTQTLACI